MAKNKVNSQEELNEQLKKSLADTPDQIDTNTNLSDIDLSEFMGIGGGNNTQYTTEVLEKREEIKSTINVEEYKSLVDYVLGISQRPDFADKMLTQLSDRYEEIIKIIVALNMLQIPKLLDYLRVLQETILDPNNIKNMTYADMSTEAVNLSKQINDTITLSLKVAAQLPPENKLDTKAEKITRMIMTSSEATKDRLMEVLEDAQD